MATRAWMVGLLAASLFAFGAGATTLSEFVVLPPDAQAELPDVDLPDVVLDGDADEGADASDHPSADDVTESGLPSWLESQDSSGYFPTWLGEEEPYFPTWLVLPDAGDDDDEMGDE